MSNFTATFENKNTGEVKLVHCIDDFFGRHEYGYKFNDREEYLSAEQMIEEGWERVRTL